MQIKLTHPNEQKRDNRQTDGAKILPDSLYSALTGTGSSRCHIPTGEATATGSMAEKNRLALINYTGCRYLSRRQNFRIPKEAQLKLGRA